MDTIRTTTTTTTTSSVQQRTPTKKTKQPKKKNTPHPVKVVYISNPMKIKTSASEFRALVQELTGQDAESPPDPARFHAGSGLLLRTTDSFSDDSSVKNIEEDNVHRVNCVVPPAAEEDILRCEEGQQQQHPSSMESNFEGLDDDVFTPQMIESISALLPASVFYESPHLNHW